MALAVIANIRHKLAAIFDQVSEPLYHNGEGPFFMATQEQGGDVKFFFYEANTVEQFLADPDKLSRYGANAWKYGIRDAAEVMAKRVLALIDQPAD